MVKSRKLKIPRVEETEYDVWVSGKSSVPGVVKEILRLVENKSKRRAVVRGVGKGIKTATCAVVEARMNALCEVVISTTCGTISLSSDTPGNGHPLLPNNVTEKKGNYIKIIITRKSTN